MAAKKNLAKENMYRKLMPTQSRQESGEPGFYYGEEQPSSPKPKVERNPDPQNLQEIVHPNNQLIYNPDAHNIIVTQESEQVKQKRHKLTATRKKQVEQSPPEPVKEEKRHKLVAKRKKQAEEQVAEKKPKRHKLVATRKKPLEVVPDELQQHVKRHKLVAKRKKVPEVVQQDQSTEQFDIINLQKQLVEQKLEAAYKKYRCCDCERCRKDITAMALANLPPIYVVKGNQEQQSEPTTKQHADAASAVIKAMLTVRAKPHHD